MIRSGSHGYRTQGQASLHHQHQHRRHHQLLLRILIGLLSVARSTVVSSSPSPPAAVTAVVATTKVAAVNVSTAFRLYMTRGLVGRIACPMEATPPVSVIMWSKAGRILDVRERAAGGLTVTKRGTLVIRSVSAADEGLYTCGPYSPLDNRHATVDIQVIVRGE